MIKAKTHIAKNFKPICGTKGGMAISLESYQKLNNKFDIDCEKCLKKLSS